MSERSCVVFIYKSPPSEKKQPGKCERTNLQVVLVLPNKLMAKRSRPFTSWCCCYPNGNSARCLSYFPPWWYAEDFEKENKKRKKMRANRSIFLCLLCSLLATTVLVHGQSYTGSLLSSPLLSVLCLETEPCSEWRKLEFLIKILLQLRIFNHVLETLYNILYRK